MSGENDCKGYADNLHRGQTLSSNSIAENLDPYGFGHK